MNKLPLLLCSTVLVTACASRGHEMTQDQLNRIKPGVTTRSDLIGMFGAPLSQGYGTDGKMTAIWFYTYVGPFGAGMRTQNLSVLFDQNDRIEKYTVSDTGK